MNKFWENTVPQGYYDNVLISGLERGKGIQPNWHNITFLEVANYVEEDFEHLDYACGPGTFIGQYLVNKSTGVDISADQINYANKKYGKKASFYTLRQYEKNFPSDDSIDIVTIIGLLEFITTQETIVLLNNIYKLLKPGGKVVVTTPNYKSNMKHLVKIVNTFGGVGYNHQHISKLDEKSLDDIFKLSNFNKFKINKFLNFGVFFSFLSIKIGRNTNNFVKKYLFPNKGYLLLGILEK
jgi:SAM-dependent methyltransferase